MTDGERVLVFDCFSGIAGDMALAALIDAGASLEAVRAGLGRLGLPPFELRAEHVDRGGLPALLLAVAVSREVTYQAPEMRARVAAAGLPDRVVSRVLRAIDALEAGEAIVHAGQADFHEVGGVDALIDIVGTMLALESLDVGECFCPVVTVGAGTIARGSHGPIPAAPGPAAAEILRAAAFPLRFVEASHELVTPTGAALLAAVAQPAAVTLVPSARGAGAGSRDLPGRPNAVRVFLGQRSAAAPGAVPGGAALAGTRPISLLEANIDDLSPVLVAHARDRLLEEGALDAWVEPIAMKKGRPALKLCALASDGDEERLAGVFLAETTTLGVRTTAYQRYEAERRVEPFDSSLGQVRVKRARRAGRETVEPEFEDLKALSARLGEPLIHIYRTVMAELGRSPQSGS